MKLTKETLKQIIKEELDKVMNEEELDEGFMDFFKGKNKEEPQQQQQQAPESLESLGLPNPEQFEAMSKEERAEVVRGLVNNQPSGQDFADYLMFHLLPYKAMLGAEAFQLLFLRDQGRMIKMHPGIEEKFKSEQKKQREDDEKFGYAPSSKP